MKLAIYGSRHQDEYLDAIGAFLESISAASVDVVMHGKLYNYLSRIMPRKLACVRRVSDGPDFEADYALSIGGDGSFLRTAAWVGNKEIPVVGINTGHLGYLAALGIDELPALLPMLADGLFNIERRRLIEVSCPGVPEGTCALNEVTVTKAETSSIIDVEARINGRNLADYRADGLIICTPTGSTAYNLSVGGPIVEPTAPVLVLSPIAAHSLSLRPLVVDDSSVLEFSCSSRANAFRLSVDGRSWVLPLDMKLTLRRAPYDVKVLKPLGSSFADILRCKLSWG